MANLIIKPSAGGQLIIKDEGGSAAITVAAAGTTTFAENTTLSGTGNNLGTVTAGTFEGTLNSSTTFSGDAGQKTCKKWASIIGTGTPATIDDFGISTIGDNGTGDVTVNFDGNMSNTGYAIVSSIIGTYNSWHSLIAGHSAGSSEVLVGSFRFVCPNVSSSSMTLQDVDRTNIAIFGD